MKIGDKYRASINLQINNITDTSTIQNVITTPNRSNFSGTAYYLQILDGTFAEDYMTIIADREIAHDHFGQWSTRFGTRSARLGLKFSF